MTKTIEIKRIPYKQAVDFLLPRHYSGRKPPVSYAFGLFISDKLKAVCTFGKPVSTYLCSGVCGEEYADKVFELNRLCRDEDVEVPMSQFVASCLRELAKEDLIIVSYADTEMNHHGYIYQASNFIYTGATKRRTDKYTKGNKHSRHYNNDEQFGLRKVRSSKHRYIYFATKNKRKRAEYKSKLKYPVFPYPKGENKTYELGEYLEPTIVKDRRLE